MKVLRFAVPLLVVLMLGLFGGLVNGYAKTEGKQVSTAAVEKSKKTTKAVASAISINSADQEALTRIPGIGPKKAQAIIKHRKSNGKFKTVDDLLKVKGIGAKSLAKMKPYLKL
ncbi:ComEA family DNA-binding protein [Desulforhopalus singaporensis]|uniref:Competence protein ComEA n=1 Tax=Desulforhopalus singaporensis TaxID=91360 RepID=A0A1H0RVF1_9BACT|nr:helix-hairpin-helix domain-containing protein [Desulforhopalus singaporensis]SDP33383.1 competence protein ComEA [Desulforhopalus singaporensis]